jgi:hypothetical protein
MTMLRPHFLAAGFTGKALLEDGSLAYYERGKIHRDDAPARVLQDGTRLWYRNDKLHREGGAAVETKDGRPLAYWHDGVFCHAATGGGNGDKTGAPESKVLGPVPLAAKPIPG